MGSKEIGLFVIFFTHFQFLASSSSPLLHKAFVSGRHEHDINGVNGDGSERNFIVHSSKFAHGGVSGGRSTGGAAANDGGSTGATESGNGNGKGQGGAAVIPVIVAGAANNRHPRKHNGAARSNMNAMGLPTMIMITSATLTVHLSVRVQ